MFLSAEEFADLAELQKKNEEDTHVDLTKPVIVRVDGRAFRTFTSGLSKPYDSRLGMSMVGAAKRLTEDFRPTLTYVQSDEISLVFCNPQVLPFNGRKQKLASLIASTATAAFNRLAYDQIPEKRHMLPIFDARVFNVDNAQNALDNVYWRSCDAVRNSVFALAFAHFSTRQLHKKGLQKQLQMLQDEKGIDWVTTQDYPSHFKVGTVLTRDTTSVILSDEELQKIPEKHRPFGPVIRSIVNSHSLPIDAAERKTVLADFMKTKEQDQHS